MRLTIDRLRELFSYDPASGAFVWKVARGNVAAGSVARSRDVHGYVKIRIDGASYGAHRLAFLYVTGAFPPSDVDHINGNRADNRWANLRPATRQQNIANSRLSRVNTSGFKGVTWSRKLERWVASIRINNKTIYLGLFDVPEAAHAAYCSAARRYFGEFARAS